MTAPTFVPRYASAVYTCDLMIADAARRIAELEKQLREWEELREKYVGLAERNTGSEPK